MKKKISVFLIYILVVLAFSACGASESELRIAELEKQLAETDAALEQTRTELSEAALALAQSEENIANLNTSLGASTAKNTELEKLVDELEAQLLQSQFPLSYLSLAETDMDKCIVLPLEELYLYSAPHIDAPKEGLVGNEYVEVLVKADSFDMATAMTTPWYLIRHWTRDNPQSEIGWVPAEYLKEYTRENMHEISYPITLSANTVFYHDKECSRIYETGASDFEISRYIVSVHMLEDGICSISAKGGASAYTYTKYLIYPTP